MTTKGTHSSAFSEYLKGLAVSDDKNRAEVVLLTCMDFRFFERVAEYMEDAKLTGKYYHLILAGAALGAVVQQEPADPDWHKTFFDHLELARSLDPQITKVIVLEHKGCKAYEKFGVLRPPYYDQQERDAHAKQVGLLRDIITEHYGLPVDSFFLTLDQAAAGDEDTLTFDRLA